MSRGTLLSDVSFAIVMVKCTTSGLRFIVRTVCTSIKLYLLRISIVKCKYIRDLYDHVFFFALRSASKTRITFLLNRDGIFFMFWVIAVCV